MLSTFSMTAKCPRVANTAKPAMKENRASEIATTLNIVDEIEEEQKKIEMVRHCSKACR